jgi:O-antigen/teichoic acid export membrane protein
MRTLARLPVMMGLSVSRTAWPEMSAAIAKNDLPLLRRIFRNTFLIGLLSNILCLALLSLLGRPIFEFWTNSKLQFDFWTFFLLCAGAAVSSFSMSTMSVLNAGNRHESSAIVWASVAALSLGGCFFFRHSLTGVGVSALLLVAEVLVSIFILLASRSYLRRSATGVTAPATV